MALPTFQLIPTATNAAAPFCLGHAFKKGDVPAGSSVTAPFSDFQCTPKNAWPDGSLKFAILAGRASVTGTTQLVSQLSVGAAATGTAIAASSISAVATVDCGTFGAVTWSGTDWVTPFQTWISGPKMSSFIYRKPVGADAHLVAWLEVRVWSGGELEVLPWIENGYLNVAGPTNKSATYTFTLGGTQRFTGAIDLKHHQRTVLVDGTRLSHWLGADPGVAPFHNQAYFMASEMVPTYGVTSPAYDINNAFLASTSPAHDYLRDTFTPLAAGNLRYDSDSMPGSGYQSPIGLLPTHDVSYLVCNTQPALLYGAVVRGGYSAGRYGTHYRDEANGNKPVHFASYPTLVIYDDNHILNTGASTSSSYTPATSGGNPPKWDVAHSPSIGYMAYLVTGRFYFKEEAQFTAGTNHYCVTDWVRGGGLRDYSPYPTFTGASGICVSTVQPRQGAWAFRSITQALAITPDTGDSMKADLAFVVQENIRYFHNMYVAQPNNPYGIVYGPEVYADFTTSYRMIPVWQQDFITAAWGMALCLGLPLTQQYATKMQEYFQWKAKSAVHRLGDPNDPTAWPFYDAAPYEYADAPSLTSDFEYGTGPWYPTARAAYNATYVGSQVPTGVAPNTLGLGYQPETAMWANLQPAISYAVRHQVPGAAAAYTRMTGAPNYSTLTAGFVQVPVWSVVPSGVATESGGILPSTPGPSAIFDTTPLWGANTAVFDTHQGHGIPLSEVPPGGSNGVSAVRALIQGGDSAASEARVRYISTPTGFAAGGDTSYTSPAGAITYEVYLDGVSLGQATDTVAATGSSTITGVTISPLAATINAGGTQQFVGTASGTGSFDPTINYSVSGVAGATGGSINSSGLLTTTSLTTDRVFNVTATSAQDSSKSATTMITVLGVSGVILAPRFARPESDASKGAWLPSTGTNLFAMIDEATADATDYIAATTPTTSRIKLGAVTDPNTSVNQVLRYQAWSPTGGSLTVRLFCGGTQIATWTHLSLPTTPSLIAQVLTSGQCDAITDYTNLFVEFTAA